jgi:hypothetical protein
VAFNFCSRSQYQCEAILPADVCVDVVHRLSVGRNQDCVPARCIILSYKLHYVYRGMIGTYMHGIIHWSPGSIQGVRVLPFVYSFPLLSCVRLVSFYETLWWRMYGWCTGVLFGGFKFVFCLVLLSCTITFHCSLSACTVYGQFW